MSNLFKACRKCKHPHGFIFNGDKKEYGIKISEKCGYRFRGYTCNCVEYVPEDNLLYLEHLNELEDNK